MRNHSVFFRRLFFVLSLIFTTCENMKKDENPCFFDCFDFRLTDFEPAWSPDGNTIAYIHGDTTDGLTGVYLINPDGTSRRELFVSISAYNPTWSPDSKWIAFSNAGQIFNIKSNGDSLTQVTTTGGGNLHPSWSPNGQMIVYNKSICSGPKTCGLWTVSIADQLELFRVDYGNYPAWLPSGDKISYLTRAVIRTGPIDTDVKEIGDSLWIFDITTDNKSILSFLGDNNFYNEYIKYSPDGTKIVFQSQPDGGDVNVWIMNADGTSKKQLTSEQGYAPCWSPDGKKIIYTKSSSDNGRLWIMNSDGSNKIQLTY